MSVLKLLASSTLKGILTMANPASSVPSFLRDAISSYAQFSAPQKQAVQQGALQWLQRHINTELADKTILDQFAQKWRLGKNQPSSPDQSPLCLDRLPGSYKGNQSISGHQEEALVYLQDVVPLQMQEDFKQRWNAKIKLEVTNASGATFKGTSNNYKKARTQGEGYPEKNQTV
jgi:hypothetical protein